MQGASWRQSSTVHTWPFWRKYKMFKLLLANLRCWNLTCRSETGEWSPGVSTVQSIQQSSLMIPPSQMTFQNWLPDRESEHQDRASSVVVGVSVVMEIGYLRIIWVKFLGSHYKSPSWWSLFASLPRFVDIKLGIVNRNEYWENLFTLCLSPLQYFALFLTSRLSLIMA